MSSRAARPSPYPWRPGWKRVQSSIRILPAGRPATTSDQIGNWVCILWRCVFRRYRNGTLSIRLTFPSALRVECGAGDNGELPHVATPRLITCYISCAERDDLVATNAFVVPRVDTAVTTVRRSGHLPSGQWCARKISRAIDRMKSIDCLMRVKAVESRTFETYN